MTSTKNVKDVVDFQNLDRGHQLFTAMDQPRALGAHDGAIPVTISFPTSRKETRGAVDALEADICLGDGHIFALFR